MNNPFTDAYIVLSKVYSEGKFLKQALAESAVEPLNKARTTAICYGVTERDEYLGYIISANAAKPPRPAVRLVLKIALYALEFLGWRDYAVVDNAVQLTKKLGKAGAAGFVNAFLRSYKIPELPAQADRRLSVVASVPLWLAKKVRRSYKEEAEAILTAPSPGVCVRFERGKEDYVGARGGAPVATPFPDTYIFRNFVRDERFFAGDYTFQSVGSAAICHAICGGESLLDMCAAPGGKSVLLAKKFKSVTACELHPHRVALIGSYCARMGADNVTPVQADSSRFSPAWEGAFDGVLCDVPCSGFGTVAENPDLPLNKGEDFSALCAVQRAILENCARYVAAGGHLYYSTCSLFSEENDEVVSAFLSAHPEFCLCEADSPLSHVKKACGIQFLPDAAYGAGFYIAKMRRV